MCKIETSRTLLLRQKLLLVMHIYQNNELNHSFWLVVYNSTINMNVCGHTKLFKWRQYHFQGIHCHFQC